MRIAINSERKAIEAPLNRMDAIQGISYKWGKWKSASQSPAFTELVSE
jgi:hypothetical protein